MRARKQPLGCAKPAVARAERRCLALRGGIL